MSAPKATEAAVAAVQQALGCDRGKAPFGTGVDWRTEVCREHHRAMVVFGGAVSGRVAVWTERGCPVAVAAADAAAPHNAAQALREAASGVALALVNEVGSGHTSTYSVRRWLHELADRIEAGQ